jgi:hypothetical protein
MMVNLKCPAIYGRIDGLRKHDIVGGQVVVRGGGRSARFGIAPYRITSPCGNFEAALPRLWYFYPIIHEFALHTYVDVTGQWPLSQQNNFTTPLSPVVFSLPGLTTTTTSFFLK